MSSIGDLQNDFNIQVYSEKKLVGCEIKLAATTLVLTNFSGITKLLFTIKNKDVYNLYDTSTGAFTANKTGMYNVCINVRFSAVVSMTGAYIYLYKNNTQFLQIVSQVEMIGSTLKAFGGPAYHQISLNKGDSLDVRIFAIGLPVGSATISVSADSTFSAYWAGEL